MSENADAQRLITANAPQQNYSSSSELQTLLYESFGISKTLLVQTNGKCRPPASVDRQQVGAASKCGPPASADSELVTKIKTSTKQMKNTSKCAYLGRTPETPNHCGAVYCALEPWREAISLSPVDVPASQRHFKMLHNILQFFLILSWVSLANCICSSGC